MCWCQSCVGAGRAPAGWADGEPVHWSRHTGWKYPSNVVIEVRVSLSLRSLCQAAEFNKFYEILALITFQPKVSGKKWMHFHTCGKTAVLLNQTVFVLHFRLHFPSMTQICSLCTVLWRYAADVTFLNTLHCTVQYRPMRIQNIWLLTNHRPGNWCFPVHPHSRSLCTSIPKLIDIFNQCHYRGSVI